MPSFAELARMRYGADAPRALAAVNEAVASIMGWRSVRAYLPDALEPGAIELLVAAAQSAATSSNLQAWSVVAVEDKARKARLAELCGRQRHIAEAPLFLAWIADLSRLERVSALAGLKPDGLDSLELFIVAVIDAALAAQNAAIAATSLGLGAVYIGGLRNHPEKVAAELGLPPKAFGVFGMAVGKPDPARPAAVKPRLPQKAVLHREQYNPKAGDAAIAAYDKVMEAFYASQKMPIEPWSRHTAKRVQAASLGTRERMAEVLKALGFGLR